MADLGLRAISHLDRETARAVASGVHGDPFGVLGPHDTENGRIIRAFLPGAVKVDVLRAADGEVLCTLEPSSENGLFENFVREPSAV